ncbi:O-fucosyltransferase family protein [Acidisoma silvae]|uniref:Uncharacterized protein n=1 Tax=Acidisoma silvae TaxID=2802396 RepID=A0A963YTZ7_9PROT|nr:hypothetical protein [Acidisoma silvae]MCB8877057.1 hypothetical protein [Acidisoma silvae]
MLPDQLQLGVPQSDESEVSAPQQALNYNAFDVGLNNQKMALLGLFHKAKELGAGVILPDLSIFNPASGIHGQTSLDSVFPVEPLYRFARAYRIPILDDRQIETISAFECFTRGGSLVGAAGAKGMVALDEFSGHFFSGLQPRLAEAPVLQYLKHEVFRKRQVKVVVQLRIEKDWTAHFERAQQSNHDFGEDNTLNFNEIFSKITKSMPDLGGVLYVVCDETNLPVSKDEIREAVLQRHGISILWKSDVLTTSDINALSLLEQSVIDFEMALEAPCFIGMSRSTFSNMAGLEKFYRRRSALQHHFIYNLRGEQLGRRYDNGSYIVPATVCDPLLARVPLAPPHYADVVFPITLIAHISTHGDFTTESALSGGAYGNPLCCGQRGDTAKRTIEGFSFTSQLADLGIEYRAQLDDGTWTEWLTQGRFAGARGLSLPLRGFSLRMTGALSLNYVCYLIASFSGKPDLVQVEEGQDCVAETSHSLEAMQIVFRRR